jgi:putative RecB family exonuclease
MGHHRGNTSQVIPVSTPQGSGPRRRFSHSRLNSIEDCPRRYEYRYVLKEREAFRTIEAVMGTVVHEALGWAYGEREEGRSPDLAVLMERYGKEWDERVGPDVQVIKRDRRPEDYRREGAEMLERFHDDDFVKDRSETLEIEKYVSVDLRGERFIGYIDRLAKDASTGTVRIIDFKTGRRVPASIEVAGLQLRGYGLAFLEEHGGLEVELEYAFLRPGRVLSETMSRSQTQEVAEQIGDKIDAAKAAEEVGVFEARPSGLCAWCGFRERCDVSGYAGSSGAGNDAAGSACPRCGEDLKLRRGRNGAFFGCSGYPDCRFTRDPLPGEVS